MLMPKRCGRFAEHRNKSLELFASKGFGQVGMRELAASLGLSAGSLYHHYPSKQHLLFDLIEEFYDELIAALGRVEQKIRAKRNKLPPLIQMHLTLHHEMPNHFRLAERDLSCLNDEQQQHVRYLREQYERRLLLILGSPASLSESRSLAAVGVIANLLNSAPSWLAHYDLNEQEQDELLQSFLAGAVSQLQAG